MTYEVKSLFLCALYAPAFIGFFTIYKTKHGLLGAKNVELFSKHDNLTFSRMMAPEHVTDCINVYSLYKWTR